MLQFKDSRLGLFVHYSFFDSDRKYEFMRVGVRQDGTMAESLDELADGLDVEDLANAAAAMKAEYVMFTAWHGNMNVLYPSAVMEKWRPGHSSKRDVIADIWHALEAKGIRLMLYVHPCDGHDFSEAEQAKLGWNDGPRYTKWNDFINEFFGELALRYRGKVMGYWFDGGLPPQVDMGIARLRKTVLDIDPAVVIVQNEAFDDNFFRRWADYGCRERINPPYRSYPMQVATVITGEWWANKSFLEWTPELAYQYLVLQASTFGSEGGGVAYATGPYVGGGWEPGVSDFFQRLGQYVDQSKNSILGTIPSQAFVTMPGPLFNIDKASQSKIFRPLIVATDSRDGSKTYIHVLFAPYEKKINLPVPRNGKKFRSARYLATSQPVGFEQDDYGVKLTLSHDQMWLPLDTVIELS